MGIVVADDFSGVGVVKLGDVAEPDFEEVGEFGHRAYCRAGGFYGIFLLDGNGRADVLRGVEIGFFEEVEKLAGVAAEGFDVAALSFGVECFEDKGGFSCSAEPCDGDVFPEGKIDVDVFEVVLADATEAN